MYEHGLGLPRDLPLAKRMYDSALDLDAEGAVPVRLALLQLSLRQWWNNWVTGKSDELSAKQVPQQQQQPHQSQTQTQSTASKAQQPQQPDKAKEAPTAKKASWTDNLPHFEDILLVVLCGL